MTKLYPASINSFHPGKDIPSLTGRVILVTGASAGLGKQSVLECARRNPSRIWLADKSLPDAEVAVADIRRQLSALPPSPSPSPFTCTITALACDTSSFESVKQAAATVLAGSDARLDTVMLNAGVMDENPGLTDEGYEIHFGTNFLGQALLVSLLTPLLQATTLLPDADVRVVILSTEMHAMAPADEGIRFDSLMRPAADGMTPYTLHGQSELALILWAKRMARVYPRFKTVAVHPGVVRTDLLGKTPGAKTVAYRLAKVFRQRAPLPPAAAAAEVVDAVDAKNQLWASVADNVRSGEYYESIGVPGNDDGWLGDDYLARDLWHWTARELEPHMRT